MAERPKNYDKWTEINAKIGDYLRERGYSPGRVDLESNWLGAFQREFGLRRDRAEEWGFTPDELNKIDKMRYNAQAELDKRTGFNTGGTLSVPNPNAIPEVEYRRWCQERLGNLDNIIHMWDIFAAIGGGIRPGSGAARRTPPMNRFFSGDKPQRQEKRSFDLFHGLRNSTSSDALASMKAQRAGSGYEAFADTAKQDKGPENKQEFVLSDAKTGKYAKPQQSKSLGEPGSPSVGRGPVTEPPLSAIYSPKNLAKVGKNWGEKAANLGLRDKDLDVLLDTFPDWVLLSRIDKLTEKGGNVRHEVETEMRMVEHLKDKLCGGSLKETKAHLKSGEGAWGAIHEKILDNKWVDWRAKQTDPDALIKMSRPERNKLARLFDAQAREETNQIMADLSGSKKPESQMPIGGADLPHMTSDTPWPSSEKTPPGEAKVPGTEGPEVQTPLGGANLPPELSKPPKSEPKPPLREEPKPPSIPVDLERPPEFPTTFPPREPGSETLPTKEPQSIQPPSETPQIGDLENPTQSVAPGKETFPMKEPECISPSSETPSFELPPLPSESKSWSLPSENLPPPNESSRSDSGDYSGSYGKAETKGDSGRGSGEGQESGGGDAGIVEGGGGGETGGGEGGI